MHQDSKGNTSISAGYLKSNLPFIYGVLKAERLFSVFYFNHYFKPVTKTVALTTCVPRRMAQSPPRLRACVPPHCPHYHARSLSWAVLGQYTTLLEIDGDKNTKTLTASLKTIQTFRSWQYIKTPNKFPRDHCAGLVQSIFICFSDLCLWVCVNPRCSYRTSHWLLALESHLSCFLPTLLAPYQTGQFTRPFNQYISLANEAIQTESPPTRFSTVTLVFLWEQTDR